MTTLYTEEIIRMHPVWTYMILFGMIGAIVALFIFAWFDCVNNVKSAKVAKIGLIVCMVCFAIGAICGCVFGIGDVHDGMRIEATFTDDFSFTSVMDRYDIVEQRGDIFVLEPKSGDM